MGKNENGVQREQKNVPICASEGDIRMDALGGQHCKGCGLSGFHGTPKKQGMHTTGMLLAQLRNHGTLMQGPRNALY